MKFKKFLPLAVLSLMLVSCSTSLNSIFGPATSAATDITSSTDPSTSTGGSSVATTPNSTPNPSTVDSTPSIPTPEEGASSHSYYQEIVYKGNACSSLPSLGEPNILVIPVEFTDYRFSRWGNTNDEVKDRIEDAFFGTREEGDLVESLSSYYYQSSYGKLNIKGAVSDIVTAPKTYSAYNSISDEYTQLEEVDLIINNALNSISSTYDLSDFDTDGDEIFDSIWLIYSAPMDTSGDSVFWAFTFWSYLESQYDGLYVNAYAWASYEFLNEGGYTTHPDAHTLIHETGHLLGLDDYYDYSSMGRKMPTGGLDMMDYNIGDHMAFSKYDLGWIEPEFLTTSGTYTLNPITSSGDSFIIAAPNFNDTPFWEYYVLEYYTPDGLNQLDSETTYSHYRMFTGSGLRLYRVNQKLGYYDETTYNVSSTIQNVDAITEGAEYVVINSNSPDRSYAASISAKNTKLVSLISAITGNPSLASTNRAATNNDLFTTGSAFNPTSVRWDDGSYLNFSFTVDSVTTTSLTLTLTKN